MLRIHSIQLTWWDVEKVIQSNPVSCVDKWFIYMWYNPLSGSLECEYILYTGIIKLAGRKVRISFLSIPRIVVDGRYYYCHYLFIYLFIFIFIYIYIFPLFMTNKIYVVREHFPIFIFNKYLLFEPNSSVTRKVTTNNFIILAFLIIL